LLGCWIAKKVPTQAVAWWGEHPLCGFTPFVFKMDLIKPIITEG
jgi:hypothetical protein